MDQNWDFILFFLVRNVGIFDAGKDAFQPRIVTFDDLFEKLGHDFIAGPEMSGSLDHKDHDGQESND